MADSILLIDDSPTIRALVKVYLMGLRCTFLEAENGAQALDLLAATPVTLIIADVKMPVLDGFAFLTRVRASADPALRQVPVIFLTGEQGAELRQRAETIGANAFLTKPVCNVELTSLVRQMLRPHTVKVV